MNGKELRIVYMGTPDFAVAPLKRLVEGGYNIAAVVTAPDKPAGRGLKMQESAVKRYAAECGLPVLQPEKLKDPQWLGDFRAMKPDLAIVVAFRMLPEAVWSIPPEGAFNLHASLLPAYRGAAPVNWAIMNGETKTGVTTFFLNDEIDKGEIIASREVAITPDDTAGTLHDKLMETGASLVVETVDMIASGEANPRPQPQNDGPWPSAPKIFKEDCRLDWSQGARKLYDKIRGLSPYPAAWFELGDTTAKALAARYVLAENHLVPGTMEFAGDELRVACADGWIYIDRLQAAGKKAMDTAGFLRGFRPKST